MIKKWDIYTGRVRKKENNKTKRKKRKKLNRKNRINVEKVWIRETGIIMREKERRKELTKTEKEGHVHLFSDQNSTSCYRRPSSILVNFHQVCDQIYITRLNH